jgi:hypothetical protein
MHYLIYKITNRLNNKIYVGKHKTEDKNDDYFGSGLLLGRAVEKHGREHFTKEILMECQSEEEMNQREADIVDEDFIARDDTYNIKLGGDGGWNYVNSTGKNGNDVNWSPKHLEKMRKMAAAGVVRFRERLKLDEELKKEYELKVSNGIKKYQSVYGNPFSGKRHTVETRLRMKKSHQGKHDGQKNGAFGMHWITNGAENKMSKDVPEGWRRGRVNISV